MSAFATYEVALRRLVDFRHVRTDEVEYEKRYAAIRIAQLSGALVEQGWVVRPWLVTTPGTPPVLRKHLEGGGRYLYWSKAREGWMDHPYRLVKMKDGVVVSARFVAEPYGITSEGMENLAKVAADGYEVTVDARLALHYPGLTVAIWIERRN